MRSLAGVLQMLSFDPLGARLLADRDPDGLDRLAGWVVGRDPYREVDRLDAALAAVGGGCDGTTVHRVVAHQLWYAWRQALWTTGGTEPLPVAEVTGRHWLAETRGRPTVLVSPLTVPAPDALHAVAELLGDRPVVAYGEDTTGADLPGRVRVPVVAGDPGGIRRILATLRDGGVLCTYPDFVYPGHGVEPVTLFGRPRPMSSGFVSLAARPGTMLLPALLRVEANRLAVHLDEPYLVRGRPTDRAAARAALRHLVADVLAGLIGRDPAQWLLLPTLTFDSPQLARLPVAAG